MAEFDIVSQVSHIEANRGLKDAVAAGLKAQSPRRRISVTDLTSLKQAYYRRKHPEIAPSLERQQAMWSGTGFHELFGAAVSSEEYLEQTVEFEGIVGKIDIFEDRPVEVKTTRRLPGDQAIAARRPSYIEQLGMYCAMTGKPGGTIIIYEREAEGPLPLSVYQVHFSGLESIEREMRLRRDALEEALASGDPSRLPACQWGNIGCDYSAVCDCKTSRVKVSYSIRDRMSSLDEDGIAARQLLEKLESTTGRRSRWKLRLNDIVFPRKAFLARQGQGLAAAEDEAEEEARGTLASMEKWGVVSRVRDALLSVQGSDPRRVPVNLGSLADMVQFHQGRPAMARLMQLGSVVQRERLPQMSPHFFMRLGFECALTGQRVARLALYYPKVAAEDAKLMVYDVSFKDLGPLRAEAARRVQALEGCSRVTDLPRCPEWMCRYCRARSQCDDGLQKQLF